MVEDIDKAVEEIQASIIDDARKTYSDKVIEWWLHPIYMGKVEDPQGCAKVAGSCGDSMHVFLKIENDTIVDARFLTDGCTTTIAAGCMACELAIGTTYGEALHIDQEVILKELNGLPEESIHCALLASNALKEAIRDYLAAKHQA
ncbi:MAG: iron-sulfur cluster assembly scaffold protein [Thermodesulfobacteriota bacterium]